MLRPLVDKFGPLDRVAVRLLVLLLTIDLIFGLLHATHVRYDVPGSGLWLLSRDRGFSEMFQYLKEAAIIGLLAMLVATTGRPLYRLWALVFSYLLVDDSLEVHETAGEALGRFLSVGPVLGVDQRDIGQVIVSALVGLAIVGGIAWLWRRDDSPARTLTGRLLVLVAALGFFGVVADSIDAIDLFGVVEDGGEMITVSAMLAVVFDHRRRFGSPPSAQQLRLSTNST